MNHPKAVMWSVIVCFAVILGVIYYISVSLVSESSPPYSTPQMPADQVRFTPLQTEHALNTLKATTTTKTTTPTQDQKTVNSLKASNTTSATTSTTTSSTQTNKTLDSLKAH